MDNEPETPRKRWMERKRRPASEDPSKNVGVSKAGVDSVLSFARRRPKREAETTKGDTLAKFSASTFDTSYYIRTHYSQHNPSTAEDHLRELQRRRDKVSDELKTYVTNNYKAFITTSREVGDIEGDMIRFSSLLNAFKQSATALQSTNFAHNDDTHMSVQREYDRVQASRDESVVSDEQEMEQLGEDIRSAVYERKFGAAIALLERGFAMKQLSRRETLSSPVALGVGGIIGNSHGNLLSSQLINGSGSIFSGSAGGGIAGGGGTSDGTAKSERKEDAMDDDEHLIACVASEPMTFSYGGGSFNFASGTVHELKKELALYGTVRGVPLNQWVQEANTNRSNGSVANPYNAFDSSANYIKNVHAIKSIFIGNSGDNDTDRTNTDEMYNVTVRPTDDIHYDTTPQQSLSSPSTTTTTTTSTTTTTTGSSLLSSSVSFPAPSPSNGLSTMVSNTSTSIYPPLSHPFSPNMAYPTNPLPFSGGGRISLAGSSLTLSHSCPVGRGLYSLQGGETLPPQATFPSLASPTPQSTAALAVLTSSSSSTHPSSPTTKADTNLISPPQSARPAVSMAIVSARESIKAMVIQLIEALASELSGGNLSYFERRQIIGYLSRLNQEERALRIFLSQRTALIHQETRQVRFQGDVTGFIAELSQVFFSALSTSLTDFLRLFDNKALLACVSAWAVDELHYFTDIFGKHVFQSEDMFAKVGKCLKVAYKAGFDLEKQGFRLSPSMARLFHPHLVDIIRRKYRELETTTAEALESEQWIASELLVSQSGPKRGAETMSPTNATMKTNNLANNPTQENKNGESIQMIVPGVYPSASSSIAQGKLRLTSSSRILYESIRSLLRDVIPILQNPIHPAATQHIYPSVINGLVRVLERYVLSMTQKAKHGMNGALDDKQIFSIIISATCLADDLIPRVAKEFSRVFQRPIVELATFRKKTVDVHEALLDSFPAKRALHWVRGKNWVDGPNAKASSDAYIRWVDGSEITTRYNQKGEIPKDSKAATISKEWRELASYLYSLKGVAAKTLGAKEADLVMSLAHEEIFRLLHEAVGWDRFTPSLGGAQQLVLDLRWFVLSFRESINKNTHNLLMSICRRIVRVQTSSDPSASKGVDRTPLIVRDDAFYQGVVKHITPVDAR